MKRVKVFLRKFIAASFMTFFYFFCAFLPLGIYVVITYLKSAENSIPDSYIVYAARIVPCCVPIIILELFRWNEPPTICAKWLKGLGFVAFVLGVIYIVLCEIDIMKTIIAIIFSLPVYLISLIYIFKSYWKDDVSEDGNRMDNLKKMNDALNNSRG